MTPTATLEPATPGLAARPSSNDKPAAPARTPVSPRLPVVSNGPRDQPRVALTFDSNLTDAMINELDRHQVESFANVRVIDVLDRNHVPATMFLSGKWMERYSEVTRRLAGDPLFELGTHSYAHVGFRPNCYRLGALARHQMAADVTHSFEVLVRFTAHPMPYFRFPGGCYDDAALDAIAPTGVTVIQYDLASGDAFGSSVPAIVLTTLSHVQNGSIIVLHLTGGNTAPLTADALPWIIQGLRARGFDLVTVTQLLGGPEESPGKHPGGCRDAWAPIDSARPVCPLGRPR